MRFRGFTPFTSLQLSRRAVTADSGMAGIRGIGSGDRDAIRTISAGKPVPIPAFGLALHIRTRPFRSRTNVHDPHDATRGHPPADVPADARDRQPRRAAYSTGM